MRCPLLTMTGKLAKAVKRLNSSLEKCKQNGRQGGILVRVDLHALAEAQTILQEDVIDISSPEKQESYWVDCPELDMVTGLNFARCYEEILLCWKGRHAIFEAMDVLDRDGTFLHKLSEKVIALYDPMDREGHFSRYTWLNDADTVQPPGAYVHGSQPSSWLAAQSSVPGSQSSGSQLLLVRAGSKTPLSSSSHAWRSYDHTQPYSSSQRPS